ncbi:MAG: polymerase sigma-70 factor, subfamily [Acidobacteriota bacterium]|nr:polymerase sigma-70 factor, subfamily [Acidobacteriota bacterium]
MSRGGSDKEHDHNRGVASLAGVATHDENDGGDHNDNDGDDGDRDEPRGTHRAATCADTAAGDMESFEEVYRRHHRQVYRLCLRMTQNVHEAEDLTQEVFVHLFRKIGSFRGESAFTTWLHRLTVNHVLMHFRKRNGRERITEDGETPNEVVRGTEHPGRMQVVDKISLDNALARLAPGYRAVFILHDVEGYEHEEIGRMLGCSTGTSKSQLHKARLRLRKLLTLPSSDGTRRKTDDGEV